VAIPSRLEPIARRAHRDVHRTAGVPPQRRRPARHPPHARVPGRPGTAAV